MTYEYDFEMVKRAYAEMARRAREKDEIRRLPRNGLAAVPTRSSTDMDRASAFSGVSFRFDSHRNPAVAGFCFGPDVQSTDAGDRNDGPCESSTLFARALSPPVSSMRPPHSGARGPGSRHAKHAIRPAREERLRPPDAPRTRASASGKMAGEVYAVLDHPFKRVSGGLARVRRSGARVLTLPFNVQKCEVGLATSLKPHCWSGASRGRRSSEATEHRLPLCGAARSPDELERAACAPSGPARHARLPPSRSPPCRSTTSARSCTCTTATPTARCRKDGDEDLPRDRRAPTRSASARENGKLVGGTRGVIERNTMRYFLAIDAYLDSLASARDKRACAPGGRGSLRPSAMRSSCASMDARRIPRRSKEAQRRRAALAAPDERHLRRHDRHELDVGVQRQARHVDDRARDVLHVHARLDHEAAVGLRHALPGPCGRSSRWRRCRCRSGRPRCRACAGRARASS